MHEQNGSRKALGDAQRKEICGDHICKLDALRSPCRARKSELLQERYQWMVEQEQLRAVRDEKSSCYHKILSTVWRLVTDRMSGEGRLEQFVPRLQMLYRDSQEGFVSAGPPSQVVEDDPRVCELRLEVAM